jgi:hypothetical protein
MKRAMDPASRLSRCTSSSRPPGDRESIVAVSPAPRTAVGGFRNAPYGGWATRHTAVGQRAIRRLVLVMTALQA